MGFSSSQMATSDSLFDVVVFATCAIIVIIIGILNKISIKLEK